MHALTDRIANFVSFNFVSLAPEELEELDFIIRAYFIERADWLKNIIDPSHHSNEDIRFSAFWKLITWINEAFELQTEPEVYASAKQARDSLKNRKLLDDNSLAEPEKPKVELPLKFSSLDTPMNGAEHTTSYIRDCKRKINEIITYLSALQQIMERIK